ncbi:MAG: 3',5'-cyclic-nucleotide phosphodiesterase [Burkholderiaceae bacterium]
MKLRVLGCSGGIGAQARTTSFLVDHDILIDAGTGVEDLSVEELTAIDHVFLTHSHLDHIAALPLLIDSVGARRATPLLVHALPETIAALRAHVFNWTIWPDFTEIPHYDSPWLRFEPLGIGASVVLDGRTIRALEARHTVPALGFHLNSGQGSLVFSGDTGPNDGFWREVNAMSDLRHLIIETAFSNRERDLAVTAKHLFPIQLSEELAMLSRNPTLWVTHLKPSDRHTIAREIEAWAGRHAPRLLERGQVLDF